MFQNIYVKDNSLCRKQLLRKTHNIKLNKHEQKSVLSSFMCASQSLSMIKSQKDDNWDFSLSYIYLIFNDFLNPF